MTEAKEDKNAERPKWIGEDGINEVLFAKWFVREHDLNVTGGRIYGVDGLIRNEEVKKMILESICFYVRKNVAHYVKNLFDVICMLGDQYELKPETDRIHFKNGTYHLDGNFDETKEQTLIRIPQNFDPDAPEPVLWLKFLHELLHEEDILTLQEFMGYCLIPTTRAQKMLIINGNGGEGKSRIGKVLSEILGDNMNKTSIKKLASDRFCRADQEGKLLMLDDDMKMEALPDTDILKTVITMEDKTDLERKGKQSIQGRLFVRIMGFGNGSLSALHDRSEGFYRRQIVLRTKDKPKDRVDDTALGDKLVQESEGIVLWMLEGLHRLIRNDYHFTLSRYSLELMEECQRQENNILEFYESEGYIRFENGTYASTRKLYAAYRQWCQDNAEKAFAEKTFAAQLGRDAKRLGIVRDKNVDIGNGKKARGYRNVCVMVRTDQPYQ